MLSVYRNNSFHDHRLLRFKAENRQHAKSKNNSKQVEDRHDISIIGVNKILNSSNPWAIRAVWVAALAVMVSLCSYQLSKCVDLYFSRPVIKQTDIVRSDMVNFPAIHICPGFARELQYLLTGVPQEYCANNKLTCWVTEPYQVQFTEDLPAFDSNINLDKFAKKNFPHTELYKMCGEKDDCGIDGVQWHGKINPTFTAVGLCFFYDTAGIIPYRGPFTYMKIQIYDSRHQKILDELKNKLNKSKTKGEKELIQKSIAKNRIGAIISVYNSAADNKQHTFFLGSQDIFVGYETHLQIHQKEFTVLNRKRNPCDTEEKVMRCVNECIEKNLSSSCSLGYNTRKGKEMCKWDMNYIKMQIENINVYNTLNITKCGCPKICNDVTYTMFPNVITKLKNESKITIKIYFADNNIEKTTEKISYDFTNCLSDFGGNLGFFLGFCSLTVIEIIEYVLAQMFGNNRAKVGNKNELLLYKYNNKK